MSKDTERMGEMMTENCCLVMKKVIGDLWESDSDVLRMAEHQKEWPEMQSKVQLRHNHC